uniref:Putative tail protein n=1 Tax=viral metagenome TaxID=1070528 RepID=A0A6M3IS27_9ZZZZ
MALAERATVIAELRLDDKMSKGLKTAGSRLRGLEGAAKRAGAGLSKIGGALATAGKMAAVAAAGFVVGSIKLAADFEQALNTINTVAMVTPEALSKIGDSMRALARETGTDLADLTSGYYDLVSAGIKAADAQKVLVAANTLAIGGLSTTGEAIDLLTTAINTYGGDAKKAAAYSDVFAKAIERGRVTAAELASSFANVGPLAASMGISVEELGAGYARLTASGTAAGEASTQMAAAMKLLLVGTGGLKQLENQTGKNYAGIAGRKGLNVALEQLRKDAKKSGMSLAGLVGRKEALLYILQTTGPNLKAYNEDLAAMTDAEGTAAKQMGERQKGLIPQLNMLKQGAKDAAITIGSALLPKLTPLVKKLNEFLARPETQAGIAELATNLATGFEMVAKWAGTVPWDKIADGLGMAAGFAAQLVGVFANMPTGVQATLLALVGLNKISGGAVSGIVGELGKGLIKGVLGMTAAVVNIKAGIVTGAGGPGGGLLPAVAGAAAGTGLALATAVIAPAAVAAAALLISDKINTQGEELVTKASEFATKATDTELANSIKGVTEQLNGMQFNTFDSKNKVIDTLNVLIAEQNRRAAGGVTGGRGDVATAARAKEGLERVGIWERAVAKGGKPNADQITRILEKNHAAAAAKLEATRQGTFETSSRISALRATLAAKNFSPHITVPVNVTVPVSVRNVTSAQSVVARYTQTRIRL